MNVIEAKHLTKVYGSGHTAITAVSDVDLTVGAGDIILIMGPSGSGKTTLLSMLGTLLRPTSGTIRIAGDSPDKMSDHELADLRLRKLGFIFQSFNLLSALTAQENVAVALMTAKKPKRQALQQAHDLLAKLHLTERLHNLPRDLSGGEKQRVAVARALANDPGVILADEPTANLDTKAGREVMQLLCETACSEGRAVVVVSHDARLKDFAKRVITIEDGKLVHEEPGNHEKHCPLHRAHR